MKALVVCPTYGRIPFLNRMLASFLSQDYDDKELVIVNDDVNITLKCDHSNVTCINMNRKIILPMKRNIGNGLGYHDIIFQHDDDDIFLPSRISNHIKKYEDNPDITMYRNLEAYTTQDNMFMLGGASPTSASYRKSAWYDVGGYRNNATIAEDLEFFDKMPNKLVDRDLNRVDYVYNWNGVSCHATSATDKDTEEFAYSQLARMGILGSYYWIEPDYDEYSKFLKLDTIFRRLKKKIPIKHLELGKIDVTDCLKYV